MSWFIIQVNSIINSLNILTNLIRVKKLKKQALRACFFDGKEFLKYTFPTVKFPQFQIHPFTSSLLFLIYH